MDFFNHKHELLKKKILQLKYKKKCILIEYIKNHIDSINITHDDNIVIFTLDNITDNIYQLLFEQIQTLSK